MERKALTQDELGVIEKQEGSQFGWTWAGGGSREGEIQNEISVAGGSKILWAMQRSWDVAWRVVRPCWKRPEQNNNLLAWMRV